MTAEQVPLFISIPHSGEKIPSQATWLQGLPEEILMCDVDRFVDFLYEPTLQRLKVPSIKTQWHRYAADLNRLPEDVDSTSVFGNANQAGSFNRGFHWVITTYKHQLMKEPMPPEAHQQLVQLIYEPFHEEIKKTYRQFSNQGFQKVYQIDAHSMPSRGTSEHRDPGQLRADIVVSDCKGTSCDPKFKDLVIAAYVTAGFKVGYNWPYFGGRVTEQYGQPSQGQHCIQVEMNRDLYMDETTKKLKAAEAHQVQDRVMKAVSYIRNNLLLIM